MPLGGQRDPLVGPVARTEVLALLLVRATEAPRRGDGAEAAQRVGALLDAAMVLLEAISEGYGVTFSDIGATPMVFATATSPPRAVVFGSFGTP